MTGKPQYSPNLPSKLRNPVITLKLKKWCISGFNSGGEKFLANRRGVPTVGSNEIEPTVPATYPPRLIKGLWTIGVPFIRPCYQTLIIAGGGTWPGGVGWLAMTSNDSSSTSPPKKNLGGSGHASLACSIWAPYLWASTRIFGGQKNLPTNAMSPQKQAGPKMWIPKKQTFKNQMDHFSGRVQIDKIWWIFSFGVKTSRQSKSNVEHSTWTRFPKVEILKPTSLLLGPEKRHPLKIKLDRQGFLKNFFEWRKVTSHKHIRIGSMYVSGCSLFWDSGTKPKYLGHWLRWDPVVSMTTITRQSGEMLFRRELSRATRRPKTIPFIL